MKTSILSGLLVLSLSALSACGITSQTLPNTELTTPTTSMPGMDNSSMGHSAMDMSSTMKMDHMSVSTEEEFIANMIPHHQEAVDTSSIIVGKTENTEIKKIAEGIILAQNKEITLLNFWMKVWYLESTLKVSYMQMMRDLSNLSGRDLDKAFMEDMIIHHEGAVDMAGAVLKISQRPEIISMANEIILTQNAEIAKFKELLTSY